MSGYDHLLIAVMLLAVSIGALLGLVTWIVNDEVAYRKRRPPGGEDGER